MSSLGETIKTDTELTELALERCLSRQNDKYPHLFDAMRYSVLGGGKRVRPFLVLETCRMLGGMTEAALPFACAIELIHSYSLVHDDLPCMDDDELRRGRATTHKRFGEANALLAGDALLTQAFGIAAANKHVAPESSLRAVLLLSEAAGAFGMVGGQQLDLDSENKQIDLDSLKHLHSLKTGALIKASCELGYIASGSQNAQELQDVREYASSLGLTFQIVDDILDRVGDAAVFGKPIGSDAEHNKTTFLSYMSVEDAYTEAAALTLTARRAIEKYPDAQILDEFAVWLLNREK